MKRALLVWRAAVLFIAWMVASRAAPAATHMGRHWPHGDPQIVVRGILAQPAYRMAATTNDHLPDLTLWDRLRYWLGERMGDILKRLALVFRGARGAGKLSAILLLIASGAALLILLLRPLTWLMNSSRLVKVPNAKQRLPTERGAVAWHALSLEAASQRRYGAAVSALFMAALRLLDERRILAFDAARTPNEYQRRIAGVVAAASPAFNQLVSCFVRTTYARTLPQRADYDSAADAYVAFTSELSAS